MKIYIDTSKYKNVVNYDHKDPRMHTETRIRAFTLNKTIYLDEYQENNLI